MRRFLLIALSFFSLTGCTHYAPPGENHPVRVVTSIDVSTTQDGDILRYRYTNTEKMEAVLKYLRRLEPDQFTPIAPDTFRTDAYEIVLNMSDGSRTVYHQIYDAYLKKNNGPWQSIDKAYGSTLSLLLTTLPSDDV